MSKPDFGEPWERAYAHILIGDESIALCNWEGHSVKQDDAHAERIVACVNACAGLSDEDLKAVPHVRELLEALKAVMVMSNSTKPRKLDEALTWVANDEKAFRMATEALAKAEGREGQDGKD